jgi:hypothetical protein
MKEALEKASKMWSRVKCSNCLDFEKNDTSSL